HLLEVTDKDFFATMRTRINDAVRTGLRQRATAGEVADFRRVTVDDSTLTVDGQAVPAQSIAAVVAVRTKDTNVFEFRDQQGRAVRSVRVTEVANVDVLFELLSSRFGIRLSHRLSGADPTGTVTLFAEMTYPDPNNTNSSKT